MAHYNKGDIVCRDCYPNNLVFGVIYKETGEDFPNRWIVRVPGCKPDEYDACHEEFLRPATEKEINEFNKKHPNFVDGVVFDINFNKPTLKLF
jgi:hypothetical protein